MESLYTEDISSFLSNTFINETSNMLNYIEINKTDTALINFIINIFDMIHSNKYIDNSEVNDVYKNSIFELINDYFYNIPINDNKSEDSVKINTNITIKGPIKYDFILDFSLYRKILIANGLIKFGIQIYFSCAISYRSGHVNMTIKKVYLSHSNHHKKELSNYYKYIKINEESKDILPINIIMYNNDLYGNEGLILCNCGKDACYFCSTSDKYKEPFECMRLYIISKFKEKDIDNTYNLDILPTTQLYWGKKNKQRKVNNYNVDIMCSFCGVFDINGYIKLFFDRDIDYDHQCIYYLCFNCFKESEYIGIIECPCCKKFYVNFSEIKRYTKNDYNK